VTSMRDYEGVPVVHHISRFSFRRPQWVSLREGLNVRSTFQFNALMTPIRANIVGPPSVATRIGASIAACHSAVSCSAFGGISLAAAGYPHDTLEDIKITYNDLVRIFDMVPAIATSCRTDLRAFTH
jgi:hypothetical protein